MDALGVLMYLEGIAASDRSFRRSYPVLGVSIDESSHINHVCVSGWYPHSINLGTSRVCWALLGVFLLASSCASICPLLSCSSRFCLCLSLCLSWGVLSPGSMFGQGLLSLGPWLPGVVCLGPFVCRLVVVGCCRR